MDRDLPRRRLRGGRRAAGNSKACFTADAYFREMFVRSDTSMSILSALPTPDGTGLDADDMVYAIDVATRIGCDGRVLMHGGAYPHRGPIDAALDGMTDLRETLRHRGVEDLHDGAHRRALLLRRPRPEPPADRPALHRPRARDRAHRSSARTRASRRSSGRRPSSPIRATSARRPQRNPDVSFVVYHSGFEPGGGGVGPVRPERSRAARRRPAHPLARRTAGIEPNSNVYAELGGTWWFVMRDPTLAAHVLGKLLKYVGEDRVVWGTDSIWFGTPAGPDPGAAHVPDLRGAAGSARLPGAHRRDQGEDLRAATPPRSTGSSRCTGPCDLERRGRRGDPRQPAAGRARTVPRRYADAAAMIAAHQAGYLL